MRLLVAIILTIFTSTKAYQQVAAIANDKINVLYKGVANPLSIAVAGYPCSKTIVKSDCGILKLQEDSCHYFFYSDSACLNSTSIIVSVIDSGKIRWVCTKLFRLKRIPDPTATFSGIFSGEIAKGALLFGEDIGIIPKMSNFDYEIYFCVVSYSIIIIHNDSIIFKKPDIIGSRIPQEVLTVFKKTESKDIVRFYNISVKGPDGTIRIINDIELNLR